MKMGIRTKQLEKKFVMQADIVSMLADEIRNGYFTHKSVDEVIIEFVSLGERYRRITEEHKIYVELTGKRCSDFNKFENFTLASLYHLGRDIHDKFWLWN